MTNIKKPINQGTSSEIFPSKITLGVRGLIQAT